MDFPVHHLGYHGYLGAESFEPTVEVNTTNCCCTCVFAIGTEPQQRPRRTPAVVMMSFFDTTAFHLGRATKSPRNSLLHWFAWRLSRQKYFEESNVLVGKKHTKCLTWSKPIIRLDSGWGLTRCAYTHARTHLRASLTLQTSGHVLAANVSFANPVGECCLNGHSPFAGPKTGEC